MLNAHHDADVLMALEFAGSRADIMHFTQFHAVKISL